MTVQPPIDQVYSSPYYRCLQTVEPFMKLRAEQQRRSGSRIDTSFTSRPAFEVRCETGLSDWYGTAPFEHPTSAPPGKLKELFPFLDESYSTVLEPTRRGESIARLHDRVAACLQGIVEQCDKHGHRAVLLCAHAAINIAAGRVLTGVMPEDVETEDFGAFTCGLSVFRRRPLSSGAQKRQGGSVSGDGPDALPGRDISDSTGVGVAADEPVGPSAPRSAATDGNRGRSIPDEALAGPRIAKWADGRGVGGGFDCLVNCDCSHLSGGEERGCKSNNAVIPHRTWPTRLGHWTEHR